MKRVRMSMLLGIIALVTSFLTVAMPAEAAAAPETYKNEATGRCLDSETTGKSPEVRALNCVPDTNRFAASQRWIPAGSENGTVTLKNKQTGFCLDSNRFGTVFTKGCNGGNNQNWQVLRNGDGTITFKNAETRRCLVNFGDSGLRVAAEKCNQQVVNQAWR